MSFAFLPLYTGDYLRDTRHLTPLKHGVYLLSLMHCWDTKGPLPLDEQDCGGICNCRSADEIEALRYILKRFFVRMDDGWYSKRMQAEIERAENISRARSEAGRKGYEAKAKQMPSKSLASASTPTPTPTLTLTTTTKEKSSARATRLQEEWLLPEPWEKWAIEDQPTWTPDYAKRVSKMFRDYWCGVPGAKGRKLDWLATWRNWVRTHGPAKQQARQSLSSLLTNEK